MYRRTNQQDKAEQVYKKILTEDPSFRKAFDDLMRLYYKKRDPEKMKIIVQAWIDNNPYDPQMNAILESLDKEFERLNKKQNQDNK